MLLIYNDVMAAEHCNALMHEHENNPDKHLSDPRDASFDNRVLFLQRMSRPVQELAAQVTMEIGKIMTRQFSATLYPETVSVVRWSAGEQMAFHRDGHTSHTMNRTHAVVVYLNDQNLGGEIEFPELGTVIKPRRALLVAYDKEMLHGVRSVLEPPRYTLTLWFTDKPELSIIRTAEQPS